MNIQTLKRSGRVFNRGCVPVLLGLLSATAAFAQPTTSLQDMLKAQTVAVRSIDAADGDFSDLEPLRQFIGGARVVQLGEPSHGAGSSFAAKARLVKFLHQQMGFDVLVWESGFYDLQHTQAALRGAGDPVSAAQLGVLKIWSASAECRPLFEYAKASQSSHRPLDMAGFDMQFTAAGSFGRFSEDLRSHVRSLTNPGLRSNALQAADEMLAAFASLYAYVDARAARSAELSKAGLTGSARAEAMTAWERETGAALRPRKAALDRVQQSVGALAKTIDLHTKAFVDAHGARQHGFMTRAIANLGGYSANLYEQYGVDLPADASALAVARENRRDAINAENLRWIAEHGYAGRKIIVWAHNAHIMNAYYDSDWKGISLDAQPGSMKPTGVFLADWLRRNVYTVGFTTYEGSDGWVGNTASTIAPASKDSLEDHLHRLGLPYAFLDLRSAGRTPNHALRQPLTLRLPKYEEEKVGDITRPYDAIFYIARMQPATLIE
jgi:erythromycin esterase